MQGQGFTLEMSSTFFLLAAQGFEEALDELSRLDAAIGDGDHGVSMLKGFRSVSSAISVASFADIGAQWMEAGKILMKEIGGTCGPLFATIFIKGGMAARGKTELSAADFAKMVRDGCDGVRSMGKAAPGEKTMVDALEPASASLAAAAEKGLPVAEALRHAADQARAGAEATRSMRATRGRGRYQGENSIGHQDAGATSVAIIFGALAESAMI